MAKQKFYVVWEGVEPGIYKTWSECQLQIKGYPNAKYKSYKTMAEAESAFERGPNSSPKPIIKKPLLLEEPDVIRDSWSVDAACSGNPGITEYQGVHTSDGSQIFHQKFELGTNNVGEFLAIVHALALLKKMNDADKTIYSDSRTAMKWVRLKKAKTTLVRNAKTERIYHAVLRAELWLKNNSYKNPILKWDTKTWGEIPADFDRK